MPGSREGDSEDDAHAQLHIKVELFHRSNLLNFSKSALLTLPLPMFIPLLTGLSLASLGVCTSLVTTPDWYVDGWTTYPVVLLAAPLTTESGVLSDLNHSCVETKDDIRVVEGSNCMSDAIYTLLYIAASENGPKSDATDIKNGTLAAKRSPSAAKYPDLTLRSVSQGPDTMPSSITSIYKSGSALFEHTSNGTHGTVRSIAHPNDGVPESQAKHRYPRNIFSFGERSKGLKLSYRTSCGFSRFTDKSLTSLRDLAYKFAQTSLTTMQSDKYALEIFDLHSRVIDHMLVTVIAEADGYGNDYEEFPFAPLLPLATEC